MYCDKDSRGLFSIMELTADEFETIRRAMKAFRGQMMLSDKFIDIEVNKQYSRATNISRSLSELK